MQPIQCAADFRETLGLSRDQVVPDIVTLAEGAGYIYREDDYGQDFFAFTQKLDGLKYLIGFNSRNKFGEPFKRFSVAHEFGHIAMHASILQDGKRHSASSYGNSDAGIEREADIFAAHFLMPPRLFASKCQTLDFSPKSISSLAEFFGVSEIAATIHFVEHTDLACTLVVSDAQGNTKRENRSAKMKNLIGWVPYIHNSEVPAYSLTADWVGGRGVERKAIVPLTDWMPSLQKQLESEEWVMKTPDGLFLTLLTPIEAELETEPE